MNLSVVAIAVAVAVLMEPVAAGTHRLVMHRTGWYWHASHHRRPRSGWEANDLFPLAFAALTVALLAGTDAAHHPAVLAVGAGASAYGVLYAVVHDVCVHGRLTVGRPFLPGRWLRWLAAAHAVHHRGGGAPYGFLLPIVRVRQRSAVVTLRPVGTLARVEKTS